MRRVHPVEKARGVAHANGPGTRPQEAMTREHDLRRDIVQEYLDDELAGSAILEIHGFQRNFGKWKESGQCRLVSCRWCAVDHRRSLPQKPRTPLHGRGDCWSHSLFTVNMSLLEESDARKLRLLALRKKKQGGSNGDS